MTDRGFSSADGSSTCPFVAFEDDRDERADRPDHRHRCFAEADPAPRAFAHQEAYCLSSAFPVCPTFQDWARREAAHARAGGGTTLADAGADSDATGVGDEGAVSAGSNADASGVDAAGSGVSIPRSPSGDDEESADDLWGAPSEIPADERPRRNPPRDWAAPPPWAGGAGRRPRDEPDVAAEFLAARSEEGQGLAGSAADRLAGGAGVTRESVGPSVPPPRSAAPDNPSAVPDPELAGLVGRVDRGPQIRGSDAIDKDFDGPPPGRGGRRPAVSSTRDRDRDRERERDRAGTAEERSSHHDGPAWERRRRFEAYPTIKTRAGLSGMPSLPRVAVLAVALGFGAIALFFLPALLGVGGRDGPAASSPTATTAVATATLEPTPIPAPTPQVYVVKGGDTLSKIAREFGLTVDQLLEANKDTITDANRIAVGDEIVIPTPPPDSVDGGEASPSASPSS